MIDRSLVTYHRFGQLVVALYDGRILAVGITSDERNRAGLVMLMAGERIDSDMKVRRNERLRRLCA